jgi:hypothetical protein
MPRLTHLTLAAALTALAALASLPADAFACGIYGFIVDTNLLTDEEDEAFTAAVQQSAQARAANSAAYEATVAARAAVEQLTARGVTGEALQSAQAHLARAEATQEAADAAALAADKRQRALEASLYKAIEERQAALANN